MLKAMIDMVMHQYLFRIGDGLFHGLQLLRDFQATAILLQHVNDAFQVAVGALEARDDCGMGCVFSHLFGDIPPWGMLQHGWANSQAQFA